MVTRVYKYGLLRPTENAEVARALMFAGHRLHNQLIEIENAYRYAKRELTADLPEVEHQNELSAKWAELKQRLLLERQTTRSKVAPTALAAEKAALLADLRLAQQAAKAARAARAADPYHHLALAELDERLKLMRKAAYESSGVTWGVRALVTDAVKASADSLKTTPWKDIRFRRWDGASHRIGVTSPGAGTSGFHQLLPAPPTRGDRRQRRILKLRVGSNGREPVFAEFPMTYHRPLPPGKIAQVCVTMVMEANRERWTAEFTVNEEDTSPQHGIGTVAINLGWRQRPDGFRVLTCVDVVGSREVVLPQKILDKLEHADSLRAIRDRLQNAMQLVVREELKSIADPPPWLAKRIEYAHTWRSALKWQRLFLHLRREGYGDAVPVLCQWYHKDVHLWQWEAAERRKALNSRKDFYRVTAAALSREYDTVLLATTGRKDIAKDEQTADPVQHNRVKAATFELELAIQQAVVGRQGTLQVLPSANKTKTCHLCKQLCDFDAARHVEHCCEHCGAIWDQDENHCQNLITHFRERPGDAKTKGGWRTGSTSKNEAKRKKMSEGRQFKAERLDAARKVLAKVAE